MNMRTYGGTDYNTVKVIANGSQIATLVAATNSMSEQTWTNTSSLSGMSTLRFESTNSTDKNGPAFDAVTINATGAGVSYSRYITTCQSTIELVEPVNSAQTAHKVLIGGQMYILVGETIYNVMGQKVND